MIYVVTHHDHTRTVWRMKRFAEGNELAFIRPVPYRRLFRNLRAPVGHYVFTDFDRLTAYEVQVAATLANRLAATAPGAKILNHPARVLERYALLRRLRAEGLNDFNVYRLDGPEVPEKYPVFIRGEDDCLPVDSPLLHSREELLATIDRLRADGVPMKRRIAVEYCGEAGPDGFFRKYGVFRVGDRIVPHHVFLRNDWYVKHADGRSPDHPEHREEESRYTVENPHEQEIRRVCDIAGIQWGRIDFSIVNGRMQTYEINTNFTPPRLYFTRRSRFRSPKPSGTTQERRSRIREVFLAGLKEIDTPFEGPSTVRFELPEPRYHKIDGLPPRFAVTTLYERVKLAIGA